MGRTHQESLQIEQRRLHVSELSLKGCPQLTIAHELGVSQGTISSDLKAIRQEWMKGRIDNLDELIMLEVKKLQAVEHQAWLGWRQSQQPIEKTQLTHNSGKKKVVKTDHQGPGDHRFLKLALSAIEKRVKLLGLNEAGRTLLERPQQETPANV